MSLVAVKKRKSGKNRKDRNKVDRKVRKKGKFPVCVFSSSSGSGIQFYLLLSPYLCFISLLYLDLYVLGDDALIPMPKLRMGQWERSVYSPDRT